MAYHVPEVVMNSVRRSPPLWHIYTGMFSCGLTFCYQQECLNHEWTDCMNEEAHVNWMKNIVLQDI